ncbi:MAG: formate dehydrogenase accessory sulfurtransferase FdhD [Bacteriovoracaceae bacterium]|jgi:FdhD protein|nr:formate dehydrogenase accessory sulfurtransferase FdhD [Bacteriovoracaceae bacterium]
MAIELIGTKIHKSGEVVKSSQKSVSVACEEALQISINEIPYTITMRTPGADCALIQGLLFTENIYHGTPLKLSSYDFDDQKNPTHINVEIAEDQLLKDISGNRTLISSSSCGFCGKKDLKDIELRGAPIVDSASIAFKHIQVLFDEISSHQLIFSETGGVHAAALFSKEQQLLSIYEDIGRHNAVDKVIGNVHKDGNLSEAKILLITGRVSYEILAKAFRAKIPIILAISAPTSLAVEMAVDLGITIAGFCRENSATVYSHPERILWGEQ